MRDIFYSEPERHMAQRLPLSSITCLGGLARVMYSFTRKVLQACCATHFTISVPTDLMTWHETPWPACLSKIDRFLRGKESADRLMPKWVAALELFRFDRYRYPSGDVLTGIGVGALYDAEEMG